MVLAHFGISASLAEVVAADPPRDGGVRAGDLRDIARAKGLSAFVVAGTFADLFEQERQLLGGVRSVQFRRFAEQDDCPDRFAFGLAE